MELVGFLLVVLWAAPMIMSMAFDKDHSSTLGGVMLSNIALFATIWLLSNVGLPSSAWWAVLFAPLLAGFYFGIWCIFSSYFHQLLQEVFKRRNRT